MRRRQRVHQPPLRRGPAVRLRGQPAHQPRGRRARGRPSPPRAACSSSAAVRPAWSWPRSARESGHRGRAAGRPSDELGGQLRYVVRAPRHEGYAQLPGLAGAAGSPTLGVTVELGGRGRRPTTCSRAGADVVAVATGAGPRRPDDPRRRRARTCSTSATSWPAGPTPAPRVLVIAQDDHVAPLSVADHLAGRGHDVTVVYATAPAGAAARPLHHRRHPRPARRSRTCAACSWRRSSASTGTPSTTRNVYSRRTRTLGEFDSVVLACGSVSDSALYDELRGRAPATSTSSATPTRPRRLVFATRQAYALAEQIVEAASVLEPA